MHMRSRETCITNFQVNSSLTIANSKPKCIQSLDGFDRSSVVVDGTLQGIHHGLERGLVLRAFDNLHIQSIRGVLDRGYVEVDLTNVAINHLLGPGFLRLRLGDKVLRFRV